jgi:hypothetical protein
MRRGRPRLNRPAIDLGTPELIRKRAEALGPQRPGWPTPDPNDASNTLGRLLWWGALHPQYDEARKMYEAGARFAWLWLVTYPKTNTIGTLARFVSQNPTEIDGADKDAAEIELRRTTSFIGKERQILDAVINTVIYGRICLRSIKKLRTGLCRLVEFQKDYQRRAA